MNESSVELLSRQFRQLRRLYLVYLIAAVAALVLYFINKTGTLVVLGLSLLFYLVCIRGQSRSYVAAYTHACAQATLDRHLKDARHTVEPVLDAAALSGVRMLPRNAAKGSVMCHEGGSGSYHGRFVRLGDVTIAHTFPMDGGKHHQFINGTWIAVDLDHDTGMDCRFLGAYSAMPYSLSEMLREEPDLVRRDEDELPSWLTQDWSVICSRSCPALPEQAFLDRLRRFGDALDGETAVCVQGSQLHILLINRILGLKVSSRTAPGEAVASADLLPELTQALSLSDFV